MRELAGLTFALALLPSVAALAQDDAPSGPISVAPFSAAAPSTALPAGWREITLPSVTRHTQYSLVEDDGKTVLRAAAYASASSLAFTVHVDPRQHPLLAWRWQVANIVKAGDVHNKAGDDYPARVYVFFDLRVDRLPFAARAKFKLARLIYGADLPSAALCYVWDSRAPVGTSVWNAYTDRVRMIVVESGEARLDQWIAEQRDIAADFRAAFGEDAPAVSGIAVGADTDNTGESTLAFFGDLAFLPKTP